MTEEEKANWVELNDLTQRIVSSLDQHDLIMSQKEKDSLEGLNDSMLFFMEKRNYKRATQEGLSLLKKLEEIDKKS
jgi:hypothetical protein